MSWLSTLIVALLVAFAGHRLTLGREERTARRNAAAQFRSAVLVALKGLYPLPVHWPGDVDYELRQVFPPLQAAVAEFRPMVPWWQRWSFDRAWFCYRCGTGRKIDLQNYHHYIAFGNNPNAKRNFQRNIDKLLAFAKPR